MTELKIDISELKGEGGDLIMELASFLKEKTEANVETSANEIIVKDEEKTVSKQYSRVLLRKFLHKNKLKDYYRVISGKENTTIVKKRKIPKEE